MLPERNKSETFSDNARLGSILQTMSGDTTSDDEGSQEDPPRYDIDDLEIIKTIGKSKRKFHKTFFYATFYLIIIFICTLER